MIDLTSGDWTALLRTPDLRLVGVEFGRLRFDRPFRLAKPDPSRANFYLVRKGGAWFRAQGGKAIFLPTGSVVGVEGRSHEWLDSSQLHPAERGARHLAFGSIQHDEYVPGYRLKQKVQFERFGSNNPVKIPGLGSFEGIKTSIFLEVEGAAHYLPAYAGNLDIMTSAGLKTAEKIAARRLQQETA